MCSRLCVPYGYSVKKNNLETAASAPCLWLCACLAPLYKTTWRHVFIHCVQPSAAINISVITCLVLVISLPLHSPSFPNFLSTSLLSRPAWKPPICYHPLSIHSPLLAVATNAHHLWSFHFVPTCHAYPCVSWTPVQDHALEETVVTRYRVIFTHLHMFHHHYFVLDLLPLCSLSLLMLCPLLHLETPCSLSLSEHHLLLAYDAAQSVARRTCTSLASVSFPPFLLTFTCSLQLSLLTQKPYKYHRPALLNSRQLWPTSPFTFACYQGNYGLPFPTFRCVHAWGIHTHSLSMHCIPTLQGHSILQQLSSLTPAILLHLSAPLYVLGFKQHLFYWAPSYLPHSNSCVDIHPH